VPVEVTPAMLHALGVRIEEVRQETLTQTIQSVATVAPDESRISHAHTRVAGWVEQLAGRLAPRPDASAAAMVDF
jgi:Cu(I)/Ag(I) efflux system membrane fusion protein